MRRTVLVQARHRTLHHPRPPARRAGGPPRERELLQLPARLIAVRPHNLNCAARGLGAVSAAVPPQQRDRRFRSSQSVAQHHVAQRFPAQLERCRRALRVVHLAQRSDLIDEARVLAPQRREALHPATASGVVRAAALRVAHVIVRAEYGLPVLRELRSGERGGTARPCVARELRLCETRLQRAHVVLQRRAVLRHRVVLHDECDLQLAPELGVLHAQRLDCRLRGALRAVQLLRIVAQVDHLLLERGVRGVELLHRSRVRFVLLFVRRGVRVVRRGVLLALAQQARVDRFELRLRGVVISKQKNEKVYQQKNISAQTTTTTEQTKE